MKSEPKKKKKNRSNPFLPHVVGSGEEIKQQWGGRQAVVKAEQINKRRRQKAETTDQQTHLSIFVWWESNGVVVCVIFKFVCFDGIEGKKLADEVLREKGERKKENKIKRKKESSQERYRVWRKW